MTVEPTEPAFRSAAELAVWQRFRDELRPHDVLLTNVRLTDALGDHECDLIIGLEGAGIAVIEVKGGRVTHNGTDWVQHGSTSKPINPVAQARTAKYALRSYLDQRDAWERRRVRLAHLVAFPYSTIPRELNLPDCPRTMVLDKNDLADAPLDAVWQALTSQETDNPPASAADLGVLVSCVQPAIAAPADASLRPSPFTKGARSKRRTWTIAGAAAGVAITVGAIGAVSLRGGDETSLDPRFDTCAAAKQAGYGNYIRDRDPEYAWYRDLDGDGRTCE